MADAGVAPAGERFEVRVTADSHFGWIRTRLSLERTMMAWLRTAVSLIGFGFAIVQFFEHLQQMPAAKPAAAPNAPLFLGLSLISAGVLVTLIAIWHYWWTVQYLWDGSFSAIAGMDRERTQWPMLAIAILLSGIGLFAFFAVLLRLF